MTPTSILPTAPSRTDAWIASPSRTIEVLQRNDFQFLKKFGQNFLIDLHVLEKIIRSADITKDDVCVEIGPGIGSLTQALAEKAGRVIAVEIDSRLIPILQENLAAYDNVTILCEDFLKLDLAAYLRDEGITRPVKVIANLPYYITTPIIMGLFEGEAAVAGLTVMVQEEVARRMQAGPGSKDYGALSLAVQYRAKATIAAFVPPNCFMPRPNVGSCVIQLDTFSRPPVKVSDEGLLFALIRAAFGQRRKTLANSLYNSLSEPYAAALPVKEDFGRLLRSLDLPETVRGEALDLGQFAALAECLQQNLPTE